MRSQPSPADGQCLDYVPEFAKSADFDATIEHAVVCRNDRIEQPAISARHHLKHRFARRLQQRAEGRRLVIVPPGPISLELHQAPKSIIAFFSLERLSRIAKACQVLTRQVNTATPGIFAQIAED